MPKRLKTIDLISLKKHIDKDEVVLKGHDECIIGVDTLNRLCYSYADLVKHYLMLKYSKAETIFIIEKTILPLEHHKLGFTVVYELEYMID